MELWVLGDKVQREGLRCDACRQGGRLTSNDRWGSIGQGKWGGIWFVMFVPDLLLLN